MGYTKSTKISRSLPAVYVILSISSNGGRSLPVARGRENITGEISGSCSARSMLDSGAASESEPLSLGSSGCNSTFDALALACAGSGSTSVSYAQLRARLIALVMGVPHWWGGCTRKHARIADAIEFEIGQPNHRSWNQAAVRTG